VRSLAAIARVAAFGLPLGLTLSQQRSPSVLDCVVRATTGLVGGEPRHETGGPIEAGRFITGTHCPEGANRVGSHREFRASETGA